MNSQFVNINNINDVLPHIEGYVIAKINSAGHIILNYVYAYDDLFRIDPENPLPGLMRRECRGIAFDESTGDIVSRPFHKFFNIGEKEETQLKLLNFGNPHVVMDKRDGSMVRPVKSNKYRRGFTFMTRGGLSSVAEQANLYFDRNASKLDIWFIMDHIEAGKTLLFEWEDPNKPIVIRHQKANLVLTNCRDNVSGVYDTSLLNTPVSVPALFTTTENFGNVSHPDEYINRVRETIGREGDVIFFPHVNSFVKLKGDHYRSIHGAHTGTVKARHVLEMYVNDTFDDFIASIEDTDLIKLYKDTYQKFDKFVIETIDKIESECYKVSVLPQKDQPSAWGKMFPGYSRIVPTAMRYMKSKNRIGAIADMKKGLEYMSQTDSRYEDFQTKNGLDAPNFML